MLNVFFLQRSVYLELGNAAFCQEDFSKITPDRRAENYFCLHYLCYAACLYFFRYKLCEIIIIQQEFFRGVPLFMCCLLDFRYNVAAKTEGRKRMPNLQEDVSPNYINEATYSVSSCRNYCRTVSSVWKIVQEQIQYVGSSQQESQSS